MSAEPRNGAPLDAATPEVEKPDDDSWRDLGTEPAGPPTGERSAALALGRLRDVRVFVVAADPARRSALARSLAALALGVETGPPDDAGYRSAIAYQPDAVICELTRPGEPGWWLVQRLRRHPLLRWTPLLLMRWWKESAPAETHEVLVARVFDNLAEALTPLRVLEERVAAGRPLGDRLEITGALPLVKLLGGARLTGALSINDGWNVFDVDLVDGRPAAAARRGMGDDATTGEAALFQAALCDFGRWTFKAHGAPPPAPNLTAPLAELADRIARRTALAFGPDAFAEGATAPLAVRLDRLRDLASTSSGLAHQLCEALAAGASADELGALLRDGEDRLVVERTVIALMRGGALTPLVAGERPAGGDEAGRAARGAAHVLAWLAADHRVAAPEASAPSLAAKPVTSTGYYQVSPRREEKIELGAAEGIVAPGAWRPSMTEDLAPGYHRAFADQRPAFADAATPIRREDSSEWPRHPDDPRVAGEMKPLPLLHDSLVPGPRDGEPRGRRMRWVALGLAILLGAALVAGLVALGSSGREPPPPAPPLRGARP